MIMSAEFPFTGAVQNATAQSLPLFKEYAWDFENNCFIYDGNGNHILLEGNEAIKTWIIKAMRTDRFSYLAYSWRFGFEGKRLIGKVIGVKERRSELRREIIECLMVNPYIKSIDNIEFSETDNGRNLEISIHLTTIYGKMTL